MATFKFTLPPLYRNREGGWFCEKKNIDAGVRPFGEEKSY